MAKKKTTKKSKIDESICGSKTLRFESVKGFAQRRPTEKKESKPSATDDDNGCAFATSGNGACADGSGRRVHSKAG